MDKENNITKLLLLKEKFFNYVRCGDKENAAKVLQLMEKEYKESTGKELKSVLSEEEITALNEMLFDQEESEVDTDIERGY